MEGDDNKLPNCLGALWTVVGGGVDKTVVLVDAEMKGGVIRCGVGGYSCAVGLLTFGILESTVSQLVYLAESV